MSVFFFHILYPETEPALDDTGQEFAGLAEARENAVESIRELVADSMLHNGQFLNVAIQITDEAGGLLDTIHAREAFIL
jgi:hypothetical protein